MQYIDNGDLKNKKIIVRVDFNIAFHEDGTIANDERMVQTLPTLTYLLDNGNTLVLMSHIGNPKGKDEKYSMKAVAERLQVYYPDYKIVLKDLPVTLNENKESEERTTPANDPSTAPQDDPNAAEDNKKIIYILENLRFDPGEKANDTEFAKKLASLADAFVNEAFSACHRAHASIVGVPQFLPAYCGFLLKREIEMVGKGIKDPQKPYVAILGGAKISTKLKLISKLVTLADHVILGGGIAHNFLLAQGKEIGKSISEPDQVEHTKNLLEMAAQNHTDIALPTDVIIQTGETKNIDAILSGDQIFDIGPRSQAHFAELISQAKTIVWNGPTGLFEDPRFRSGTEAVLHAIIANNQATSLVGGGDTLSAIAGNENKDKITHISTGGGAMLEFMENGTLPGIEALK